MPKPEVEEFAQLLISSVRDMAVSSCDTLLEPDANSVTAIRWREKMRNGSPQELERMMIPDCVDQAVFFLLQAIDSGLLELSFRSSNGTLVDLTKDGDGEMSGWYMATGSWRANYSKERFFDDFADLA